MYAKIIYKAHNREGARNALQPAVKKTGRTKGAARLADLSTLEGCLSYIAAAISPDCSLVPGSDGWTAVLASPTRVSHFSRLREVFGLIAPYMEDGTTIELQPGKNIMTAEVSGGSFRWIEELN